MAISARYRVPLRRRREGKTDYRKRLKLLKSSKPRLVVRKSLNRIMVQLISFEEKGDRVLASADSKELEKLGWKGGTSNLPAAYLAGLLCAARAKMAGAAEAVLDTGLRQPVKGTNLFAALKGALDAGLAIPHDEGVLPAESRIRGEHISGYAAKLGGEKQNRFSQYLAKNLAPEELPKHFEEIKSKIISGDAK